MSDTVFNRISKALLHTDLSSSLMSFLGHLTMWAGDNNASWRTVETMANHFNVSKRTILRWTQRLEKKGLIRVDRRGRVNRYIPFPGDTPDKAKVTPNHVTQNKTLEFKKRSVPAHAPEELPECAPTPKSNANVVEKSSPTPDAAPQKPSKSSADAPSETIDLVGQTPRSGPCHTLRPKAIVAPRASCEALSSQVLGIVEDIEEVTGDKHSTRAFEIIAREVDHESIREALSFTRTAMNESTVFKPGGYFIAVLKEIADFSFDRGAATRKRATEPVEPSAPPPPQKAPNIVEKIPTSQPPQKAPVIEPEPIDPHAMAKGWRATYQSNGINSLLFLVERCVEAFNLDVRQIWQDITQIFTGERVQVDRFLDVILQRMRSAEA